MRTSSLKSDKKPKPPACPRVLIFNIPGKAWQAYSVSNDLPHSGTGEMRVLRDRMFYLSYTTQEVLEYKPDEATRWVALPGINIDPYQTIFFDMDYNELLL